LFEPISRKQKVKWRTPKHQRIPLGLPAGDPVWLVAVKSKKIITCGSTVFSTGHPRQYSLAPAMLVCADRTRRGRFIAVWPQMKVSVFWRYRHLRTPTHNLIQNALQHATRQLTRSKCQWRLFWLCSFCPALLWSARLRRRELSVRLLHRLNGLFKVSNLFMGSKRTTAPPVSDFSENHLLDVGCLRVPSMVARQSHFSLNIRSACPSSNLKT
jgi:hypothetical protein